MVRRQIITIHTLCTILIELGIPDTRELNEFRKFFIGQGKSFLTIEFLRRRIDLNELEMTNKICIEKSKTSENSKEKRQDLGWLLKQNNSFLRLM
jgi:hypothetical protein